MSRDFQFRYGISPQSLTRWVAFQRIDAIRQQRGPQVGWAAMNRIVDAELQAIERVTAEHERREVEALRPASVARPRRAAP